MTAPFSPFGEAGSETSSTIHPGTMQLVLLDGNEVTIPNGTTVEAVPTSDAGQWVVGVASTSDGVTINLNVGTEEGADFQPAQNLIGTITTAAASADIVGVDTLFLSELNVGDIITVEGTFESHEVTVITDDLNATLSAVWGSTNAGVSYRRNNPFDSWKLHCVDSKRPGIPVTQINGLRVTNSVSDPIHDIVVSAGSVRDSTNTVDLILASSITKRNDADFSVGTNQGGNQKSAVLTGTITSTGGAVAGTGTAFLTNFDPGDAAMSVVYKVMAFYTSVISAVTAATTSPVTALTDDDTLSTGIALGATADAFNRGGVYDQVRYAVVLMRRDSDGLCDVSISCLPPNGVPDLPTGWTHYRILATLYYNGDFGGGGYGNFIVSLINDASDVSYDSEDSGLDATDVQSALDELADEKADLSSVPVPKAVFTATVTSTAVAAAASANTGTDVTTWAAPHNIVTGTPVWPSSVTHGGLTVGTCYYFRAHTDTTGSYYLTLANALADTSRVNITSSTAMVLRQFIYTDVGPGPFFTPYGLSTVAPVSYIPGTTALGFEFNLATDLDTGFGVAKLSFEGLTLAATNMATGSSLMPKADVTASKVSYPNAKLPIYAATDGTVRIPTTIALQALTPFNVDIVVWG